MWTCLNDLDRPVIYDASRACDRLIQPRKSRPLLARLLCSTALLMGGGTAFAETCAVPFIQTAEQTCSDLVVGSKTEDPSAWTPIDIINKGTIKNVDSSVSVKLYNSINVFEVNKIENDGTFAIINDPTAGIKKLVNNGSITSTGVAIRNFAVIDALTNKDLISGLDTAIENPTGLIKTLTNEAEGTITSSMLAIANRDNITTLLNHGHITSTGSHGIYNDTGTIKDIENDGFITGAAVAGAIGVYNSNVLDPRASATITLLNNLEKGSISGYDAGVKNDAGSVISTLTNSGAITGVDTGLSNAGSIPVLTNNATGSITGAAYGIQHSGTIDTLTNKGTIKAQNANATARGLAIETTGKVKTLDNSNLISGSSTGGGVGYGVENYGEITALTNKQGGSILGSVAGVYSSGSIGTLTNAGAISGHNETRDAWGLRLLDSATLGDLVNDGEISGVSDADANGSGSSAITAPHGYGVNNEGAITTLTNNQNINGSFAGLLNRNTGSITTVDNNLGAFITGGEYGVYNTGFIDTLTNRGTIKAENTTQDVWGLRVDARATLNKLFNYGEISGSVEGDFKGYGVDNEGEISTLTNSNKINGSFAGLHNRSGGNIQTVTNNSGASITGGTYGVLDVGFIDRLTNDGTIKAKAPGAPTASATGLQVAIGGYVNTLQNNGSITAENTTNGAYGVAIKRQGTIGTLNNTSAISATSTTANATALSLDADANLRTLDNSGSISGSATAGGNGYGVANAGEITTLSNSKTITGSYAGLSNTGSIPTFNNNAGAFITGGVYGVYGSGTIGALTNAGTIKATAPDNPAEDATGLLLDTGARITTLANRGEISAANSTRAAFAIAIRTEQIFDAFTNTRSLSATSASGNATALFLDSPARIRTLTNEGLFNGASTQGGVGIGVSNGGTIDALTNKSAITGSTFGISNTGTINTFTNYQGGGGASAAPAQKALTYQGQLPGSYFIHITSSTYYGQLVFTNPTGSMTFGVTPTSNIEKQTYYSVLSNLDESQGKASITGDRFYKRNGQTWYLELHSGSTNVWDLVYRDSTTPADPTTPTDPTTPKKSVTPSATSTLVTVGANLASQREALNARTAAMTGAMEYDCATFDAQGYCLSFQARYSAMDSMSEGAGVLIGAKRVSPQVRLGGFLDYSLASRDPNGLKFGDRQPLMGAFLGYDQEGEGRGLQGKLSAAINMGAVTVSRAAALPDTEPGAGKASLNSNGVAGEIGWGLALEDGTVMTPYMGLRRSLARRGAYGERAVEGVVDFPISYAAFSQSFTTATAGLRLKGQVTNQIGFQFGLGAEYDLAQKASAHAGSSAITGLETFALPGAETSNRFRPVGNAGLFYQIDRNQRLTGNVSVRGQAFSSQTAVNVMGGYQVAF